MPFSLTLERQFSDLPDPDAACDSQTVQLSVSVTAFVGLTDGGIFVFSVDQFSGAERYSHIANPCDLQRYNLNIAGGLAYVRRDLVELYFGSSTQAQAADTGIAVGAQRLVDELEAAAQLGAPTTTTYVGTA